MLIGRTAEWAEIDGALRAARAGQGCTVLLLGEAGVGKTALLDRAAETPGVRVLRATGVEAEADLGYAAVHQLIYPLLDQLTAVPSAQARALRVALGLELGETPDRFLVALGLLSLVSEAAVTEPLLLVLDDVQWWDSASLDAVLFVARRIAAEPVTILVAAREQPGADDVAVAAVTRLPGVVHVRVAGLDDDAATALVRSLSGVEPAASVQPGLVERTRGNPLALVELVGLLSAEQLAGSAPLPRSVSLGDRLERPFLDRAATLTPAARSLLLMAAAEPGGDIGLLAEAAGVPDAGAVVDEVEGSGLARYDGQRLTFVHPLARSAVYADTGVSERRQAHLGLARALAVRGLEDRSVWHRAAAALGTDDELAAALDEVAERARGRSGYAAAAAAHERSAELTGSLELRVERFTAAAEAAWLAGQPRRARVLAHRAEPDAARPRIRSRLLALRAHTAARNGDVEEAHRLFMAGADLLRKEDPAEALELLACAVEAAGYSGEPGRLSEIAALAGTLLLPRPDERQRFLLAWLSVNVAALRGNTEGTDHVREALAPAARLGDPRFTVWAGIASLGLGDIAGMQLYYAEALDQARQTGAAASLPYVLEHSSTQMALAGRYAAARAAAEEGLGLAREYEQQRSVGQLQAVLAFIASITGDFEEARHRADEARTIASPRRIGLTNAMVGWALARVELGQGRPDEALERLVALAAAKPGDGHLVVTLWSTVDLVEAAVRAHRTDEVLEHLAAVAALAKAAPQPGTASTAAWCRGLLGGPDAAADLATAAEQLQQLGFPVASARARMALGELLRRDRQPRAAREHLRAAFETFHSVGAAVWAERAAGELRASGDAVPAQEVSGLDSLTAQELQIARYVSQGASNKDIAAQLFLSPRTVEYHLYKAYPKLGVTSRSQLISRFAAELATASV